MSSYTYRSLWIKVNGLIPKDANNRSYEIHHIDGNHSNNSIENLTCITIEEHYAEHYKKGDWGACVMIAKRMSLPSTYLSDIQRGKKRPGIGGVKKGTIPWNKGRKYSVQFSEDGIRRQKERAEKYSKIKNEDAERIISDFNNKTPLISEHMIGKTMKNGKKQTYKNLFAKEYGIKYGVTPQYIIRILNGLVKNARI